MTFPISAAITFMFVSSCSSTPERSRAAKSDNSLQIWVISNVYTSLCSVHWNATGWPRVLCDTTGRLSEYLQGTLEHHWKNSWNCPTLECHWRNSEIWNDKMVGHQAASGQVSVNSTFTWSLVLCKAYRFCSRNEWVHHHHLVNALNMSTIIVLLYLRLKFKWNQLISNNSRHTSFIHKGLLPGMGPDLMTSKQDAVSKLGYHWTNYTGTTLAYAIAQWSYSGNPVLICIIGTHWLTTGATSADASTQWCPNGNPVLICIIGTHWKTTESTLESHWLPQILSPVAF